VTSGRVASNLATSVGGLFSRAASIVTNWVTSPTFSGIPSDTNDFLVGAMPLLLQNKDIVNEIYAGDTSVPGGAFVDVTTVGGIKWLVRNSSNMQRQDFLIPWPTMPLVGQMLVATPTYSVLERNWNVDLRAKPGVLQVLPAAATATSRTVRLVVGMGYNVSGTVAGAAAVSFGTDQLSKQLNMLTQATPGTSALVFELSTGAVVGVSWLGEPLIDASMYNTSQTNPVINIVNVVTIGSNWAMRQAIDFLGGYPVLSQPWLAPRSWTRRCPATGCRCAMCRSPERGSRTAGSAPSSWPPCRHRSWRLKPRRRCPASRPRRACWARW